MEITKVGIREFRFRLAEFIASNFAVVITRHGQTVGYFIPTNGQAESDIAALKIASKALDKIVAAKNIDIESVISDFKITRRNANSTLKKMKAKAA
jgi:hypothetical protein